ncbi:alkaline shock response membrane anchor protein AmaP [uncultured Secundilactobacillus sp.]|uniref:alkaline shock response membrane anchor protein AmaP n=1 Tax=uncultured Secundilactobacillus sp. TaxID=2813935 RepID=UPI0025899B45|nr:alkaline shock response membrane anchor protein AmaP [uncultured Secundilactobacillus sp.]
MRLIVKILIIIGIVLAVPLAVALIWQNWTAALGTAAPESFHIDWLTQYGPIYLFWGGVVLAFGLLISLLLAIWWPRPRSLYLHQKDDGQITVTKKAIEKFTLSALQHEPYIGNPKVSAKLSRNKIKLNIRGDLMNSLNAQQHTADFLAQLETDLRRCLGISQKKRIVIKLDNFNTARSQSKQPRVV